MEADFLATIHLTKDQVYEILKKYLRTDREMIVLEIRPHMVRESLSQMPGDQFDRFQGFKVDVTLPRGESR